MPDANSRFRTSLWDVQGYLQETILDRISDTQVVREINAERSYTFNISIRDILYPLIKHRKIIRLHDTQIDPVSSTIYSSVSPLEVTLPSTADVDKFALGDYIQIFEYGPQSFVARTTANETSGDNQTIAFENSSGTLTVGSFVKIIERIDEEKLINNEYVKSPNAEVVEVLSVSGNSFNADLGYDYNAGAVILQPGRSFITKVLGKYGPQLILSRKDFTPGSGALIQKVNFETFRIKEIRESRESGIPTASINCSHITMDLNDTMFFKDTRVDVSYASKGTGQVIQDRVDVDTMLDNILVRHTDSNGLPINPKNFIKGDLLRFRYSKGKITTTAASSRIEGDSESDLQNVKVSPGSKVYVDGNSGPFTVISTGSDGLTDANSITLSAVSGVNLSDKDYVIVSKGFYTSDSLIGNCTIDSSDKSLLNSVTFQGRAQAFSDGRLSTGAVVQFQGDDDKYYIDHIVPPQSGGTGYNIYLNKAVSDLSGSGQTISITKDEREINISSLITSLGVLNQMVETFTDDEQEVYYWVNEDRSIDVIRKPIPDYRDPTSDLIIQYRDNQIRNLRSITREFELSEFGNRIIPLGASSNWINCESGVRGTVASRTITGTTTGFGGSGNGKYIEDTNKTWVDEGVLAGMSISDGSNLCIITRVGVPDNIIGSTLGNRLYYKGSTTWGSSVDYTITPDVDPGQIKLVAGDTKKFRFGDPVHILHKPSSFTISEVNDRELTRGISGITTATGLTGTDGGSPVYPTLVDSSKNFDTLDIEVGMFVKRTSGLTLIGKKDAPEFRIVGITTTSSTNDTLQLYPINNNGNLDVQEAYKVLSGTEYRIATVSQYNFGYDYSETTYTDYSNTAVDSSNTLSPAFLAPNVATPTTSSPSIGDAFFFGSNEKFSSISITMESGGLGGWTIQWRYSKTNSVYASWPLVDFDSAPYGPDAQTKVEQEVVHFKESGYETYVNRFIPPDDWDKQEINSQSAYWVVAYVSATSGTTNAVPRAGLIFHRQWEGDEYTGGKLIIDSGPDAGAVRNIIKNTTDTITINRKLDNPSAVINVNATAAKKISNAFVKGFGLKKLKPTASTLDTVEFSDTFLPVGAYTGGQLTAQGQVYKIASNGLDDFDNPTKSIVKIHGHFQPLPGQDNVEIVALPQMFHHAKKGTLLSSTTTTTPDTDYYYGEVSFTDTYPNGSYISHYRGAWDGGTAHVIADESSDFVQTRRIHKTHTDGQDEGNDISLEPGILQVGNSSSDAWKVPTDSSGTAFQPAGSDYEMIFEKETDLYLNLTESESETNHKLNGGDKIVQLMKQTGGPLTVGKHRLFRTYAHVSTPTVANLASGKGSLFKKNQIIFMGTKDLSENVYFNVGRGDQAQGQQLTIKKVVSISGNTNDDASTKPNSNVVDTTKNFVELGVKVGMMVSIGGESKIISIISNHTNTNDMLTFAEDFVTTSSNSGGTAYTIDSFIFEEPMNPSSQTYDAVELIGFTHEGSVRKNDIVEITSNDSSVVDPLILYDNAYKRLQKINEIEPRYTVSFLDLYEYDAEAYPFDKYVIGDTVKIIDEDITGLGGANLKVLRESFSPELPADKTHSLEVGKRARTFIRDDYLKLRQDVRNMNTELQELTLRTDIARCIWFSEETKSCTKANPPNSYCNSMESNRDGRMTREKQQITRIHCQAYRSNTESRSIGADASRVETYDIFVTGISSDTTTYEFPFDTDFILTNKSSAYAVDVEDSDNIASGVSANIMQANIKLDSRGQVIPYLVSGKESGTGGYIQVTKTSGDSTSYQATILVFCVGYDI